MPAPHLLCTASALCVTCHAKSGWSTSSHRLSNATWNGSGVNPWPHTCGTTVSSNACENCHRPHSAGGKKWLLNHQAEENNCYACHNGNVASKNIEAEFTGKPSIHPLALNTGVHDAAEPALSQTRHVECADCHNSHATNSGSGTVPGSMAGVRGISISGTEVKQVAAEYQLCFRCHGDSSGMPPPRTNRQIAQNNTRLEFDTINPSFHPVAGPGKNANVPSLLTPWTVNSIIKCSDCHANNAGPGAGGTGPKGPHGSIWIPLLERRYVTTDNTSESASNYALTSSSPPHGIPSEASPSASASSRPRARAGATTTRRSSAPGAASGTGRPRRSRSARRCGRCSTSTSRRPAAKR